MLSCPEVHDYRTIANYSKLISVKHVLNKIAFTPYPQGIVNTLHTWEVAISKYSSVGPPQKGTYAPDREGKIYRISALNIPPPD